MYGAILNTLFNLFLTRTPGTKELISRTLCPSLFKRQSCPIMKGEPAVQSTRCVAPPYLRDSPFQYIKEEQLSCSVHSLCCSSLAQRQSRPIQKWGASLLRDSSYGENCACGMSEEDKISPSTKYILAIESHFGINIFHNTPEVLQKLALSWG